MLLMHNNQSITKYTSFFFKNNSLAALFLELSDIDKTLP